VTGSVLPVASGSSDPRSPIHAMIYPNHDDLDSRDVSLMMPPMFGLTYLP